VSRWSRIIAWLKRLPNPVKIVGALGALVGLILGVIQLYNLAFPPPGPAQRSVLFIVDTSKDMRGPYGGGQTKLQAVKREILRFVRNQPDVLVGLRFVGSICTQGYQPPTVGFGTHQDEDITRALAEARPARIADLSGAVGQGANDFLRYDRAGKAAAPSMWVFFGGVEDPCGLHGLADEIAAELTDVKVHAKFDFFAIRKTLAGRKEIVRIISALKKQHRDAKWVQPRNPQQLRSVVRTVAQGELPSAR
jgi:hypothetical protein